MAEKRKLLVADDEEMIREAVASYLESQGYQVFRAENGEEALNILKREPISLVILDLMLPDLPGEEVCVRIRKQSRVPIIMLTAINVEYDMIHGLDLGADDYITKPFSLKNLSARVQAVLRRSTEDLVPLARQFSWNQGDLVIDYDRKEVMKKGEPVALTAIEWKLLAAFTKYPQKIFTRENLIELVFGLDFSGYDRVIDTHIKNLRKKKEAESKQPVNLCTVHGMGYKFGGTAE